MSTTATAHSPLDCLPDAAAAIRVACFDKEGNESYAVSETDPFTLTLIAPVSAGLLSASVAFRADGEQRPLSIVGVEWQGRECENEIFSVALPAHTLPAALCFFRVDVQRRDGRFSLVRDGIRTYRLQSASDDAVTRQLLVYRRAYPVPRWLLGGVIYQVFVDRFARGKDTPLAPGAVFNPDWDNGTPQIPAYPGAPLKNNMFFGGNLDGVTKKLDYLASLGVTCLYLSPIARAASNHKYDTGDYREIDPSFGDTEDLKTLIRRAKQRGIRVILDGVYNHTGDDSRYFNRHGTYDTVGAYQSKDSPYADWYTFTHFPDKYACWWDIEILPKLNLKNQQVRDFLLGKDGVIDFYASLGIAGLRLDVADELDDDFIRRAKSRLAEHDSENVLFGEVWEDASDKIAYGQRRHYYLGDELDGVMNYPMRRGILSYIKEGTTDELSYALDTVLLNAPEEVRHLQMNFLGTHDTERILSALSDLSFEGKSNAEIAEMHLTPTQKKTAVERLKLAFAVLFTLPGVPCIYYGDEAGMQGYKDPFNRMPFPWKHIDRSVHDTVRDLLAIRRAQPVYTRGQLTVHRLDRECFVFSRTLRGRRITTVINRSDRPMILAAVHGSLHILWGASGSASACLVPPVSAALIDTSGTVDLSITSPRH